MRKIMTVDYEFEYVLVLVVQLRVRRLAIRIMQMLRLPLASPAIQDEYFSHVNSFCI